ncbi:hypothetical protein UFOVP286_67 [uncultured Caudovirales phage]|uniref:Uncharacterized protein n=1 Tax=uncultured Caudovirales phage TaxID=2100421 RepID=A0A6J5LVQ8_9CAUD|nr:hypothetical protein UFOVP286_67 [uncultured Caudovirales phage]
MFKIGCFLFQCFVCLIFIGTAFVGAILYTMLKIGFLLFMFCFCLSFTLIILIGVGIEDLITKIKKKKNEKPHS